MEHELMVIALSPGALADGPVLVYARSEEMLQELASLGLTHEASLGIQRVVMQCGVPLAVIDPDDLTGLPDDTD